MANADNSPLDVVAIPGFGACAEVWAELGQALRPGHRLQTVDLPMHPGGAGSEDWSLKRIARAIALELSGPAVWMGWSLGALVAFTAAALLPERVRGVVAVAMGPRFVTAPDWPNALSPDAVDGFKRSFAADPEAALGRFYVLQTRTRIGPERGLARRLKNLAGARGHPPPAVLMNHLELLAETDLRARCAALECPVLTLLGSDDALVPQAVRRDLAELNPLWQVKVIEGAGHAPFLSHREEFQRHLENFLAGLNAPVSVTG